MFLCWTWILKRLDVIVYEKGFNNRDESTRKIISGKILMYKKDKIYYLFSKSGFEKKILNLEEKNVKLIEIKDLLK